MDFFQRLSYNFELGTFSTEKCFTSQVLFELRTLRLTFPQVLRKVEILQIALSLSDDFFAGATYLSAELFLQVWMQ